MTTTSKLPRVIFFRGVFKKDCVDDAAIERHINKVLADVPPEAPSEHACEKLPSTFISVDAWPTSTNLLCWGHSMPFTTMPLFIPGPIEPTIREDNMFSVGVQGVFCSFACMACYVQTHDYSATERIEIMTKLNWLHRRLFGCNMPNVSIPPPHVMQQYGGPMPAEEYLAQIERTRTVQEATLSKERLAL